MFFASSIKPSASAAGIGIRRSNRHQNVRCAELGLLVAATMGALVILHHSCHGRVEAKSITAADSGRIPSKHSIPSGLRPPSPKLLNGLRNDSGRIPSKPSIPSGLVFAPSIVLPPPSSRLQNRLRNDSTDTTYNGRAHRYADGDSTKAKLGRNPSVDGDLGRKKKPKANGKPKRAKETRERRNSLFTNLDGKRHRASERMRTLVEREEERDHFQAFQASREAERVWTTVLDMRGNIRDSANWRGNTHVDREGPEEYYGTRSRDHNLKEVPSSAAPKVDGIVQTVTSIATRTRKDHSSYFAAVCDRLPRPRSCDLSANPQDRPFTEQANGGGVTCRSTGSAVCVEAQIRVQGAEGKDMCPLSGREDQVSDDTENCETRSAPTVLKEKILSGDLKRQILKASSDIRTLRGGPAEGKPTHPSSDSWWGWLFRMACCRGAKPRHAHQREISVIEAMEHVTEIRHQETKQKEEDPSEKNVEKMFADLSLQERSKSTGKMTRWTGDFAGKSDRPSGLRTGGTKENEIGLNNAVLRSTLFSTEVPRKTPDQVIKMNRVLLNSKLQRKTKKISHPSHCLPATIRPVELQFRNLAKQFQIELQSYEHRLNPVPQYEALLKRVANKSGFEQFKKERLKAVYATYERNLTIQAWEKIYESEAAQLRNLKKEKSPDYAKIDEARRRMTRATEKMSALSERAKSKNRDRLDRVTGLPHNVGDIDLKLDLKHPSTVQWAVEKEKVVEEEVSAKMSIARESLMGERDDNIKWDSLVVYIISMQYEILQFRRLLDRQSRAKAERRAFQQGVAAQLSVSKFFEILESGLATENRVSQMTKQTIQRALVALQTYVARGKDSLEETANTRNAVLAFFSGVGFAYYASSLNKAFNAQRERAGLEDYFTFQELYLAESPPTRVVLGDRKKLSEKQLSGSLGYGVAQIFAADRSKDDVSFAASRSRANTELMLDVQTHFLKLLLAWDPVPVGAPAAPVIGNASSKASSLRTGTWDKISSLGTIRFLYSGGSSETELQKLVEDNLGYEALLKKVKVALVKWDLDQKVEVPHYDPPNNPYEIASWALAQLSQIDEELKTECDTDLNKLLEKERRGEGGEDHDGQN